DPQRGNQRYPASGLTGPNVNLRPETGDARTLGFVYSGRPSNGLEAAVTLWQIDYTDHIGVPGFQNVVKFPGVYPPDFISRAAPTQQDIQNGFPGKITLVKSEFVNFGKINAAGVDFEI